MAEPQFYLASASPRRFRLLTEVRLRFDSVAVDIDESRRATEPPEEYVVRMALQKVAQGVGFIQRRGLPPLPVLAADTSVVIGDRVFGKPKDAEHAKSMLQRLSGRVHSVLTAVAIAAGGQTRHALSRTEVVFRSISDAETRAYWESGEPIDKAGGYAIQGLGSAFVTQIKGSYTGVVGLPMYETHKLLKGVGVDWL